MASRLDPKNAKQKFYTEKLPKGCSLIAFYNHGDTPVPNDDVERLKRLATELYGDIPWQVSGDPIQYFVWVDFTDEKVQVGIALSGDQVTCGSWEQTNEGGITTIERMLIKYAEDWRSRDPNELTDQLPEAMVNRLQ